MITLQIDVSLLDKSRFKEVTRRNGNKAVFCDLVLIDTPDSEWGDYMVKQGTTKQEREQGVKMPILGNGKKFAGLGGQGNPPVRQPKAGEAKAAPSDSDDVPF